MIELEQISGLEGPKRGHLSYCSKTSATPPTFPHPYFPTSPND
jgi:hypothetical protein